MNINNIRKGITIAATATTKKTTGIFKRANSAVRKIASIQAIKKDPVVRLLGGTARLGGVFLDTAKNVTSKVGSGARGAWLSRASIGGRQFVQKKGTKAAFNIIKPMAGLALLNVGAVGMMSVGIMSGINNGSKDIVLERYMADQRFSRDILLQSRVGLSMGTSSMNKRGSTTGLSNALSRTRHGAR